MGRRQRRSVAGRAAAVIAVDSSALIAILFGEPEAQQLTSRMAEEGDRVMSVVSYVETGTVLAGRMRNNPEGAIDLLDRFLTELGVSLRAVY